MSESESRGGAEEGLPRPPLPARAFLGLGSNVQPRKNVIRALQMLAASEGVCLSGISTFYRTPALSPPSGEDATSLPPDPGAYPDFLNGAVEIRTSLDEGEMVELLGRIEEALGRIRLPDKYAPRTMDMDLLLYLPEDSAATPREAHPDVLTRPWVALPLLELDPELRLPPEHRPLAEVAASFTDPGGKEEAALTGDLRDRFLPC